MTEPTGTRNAVAVRPTKPALWRKSLACRPAVPFRGKPERICSLCAFPLLIQSELMLGRFSGTRARRSQATSSRVSDAASGLAAAGNVIHDLGHCSFPRTASPMPRPYGPPAPGQTGTTAGPKLRWLRPGVRQRTGAAEQPGTLTPPHASRGAKAIAMGLDGQPSSWRRFQGWGPPICSVTRRGRGKKNCGMI